MIFLLFNLAFSAGMNIDWKHNSFKEAMESESKIEFHMKSKKAGLVTTSFEGVAKEVSISFNETKDTYTDIKISIASNGLDTDVDGRNEKMWDLCLSADTYKSIVVSLPKVLKDSEPQKVEGEITIRDKSYPVDVSVVVNEQGLEGDSTLSLKGLDIPDPSIWIASVLDPIAIKFKITMHK
ncbi:MAG: YceI family protein [Bdellovibrionales bacterium]|nr:YceI family protein [Bdellovibrionales bacterium]